MHTSAMPYLGAHAPHRRSMFPWATVLALVAAGVFLTLVFLGPMMALGGGNSGEGNVVRQICYLAVLLAAMTAARPFGHPKRLMRVPVTLMLALGWCWLSVTWSSDPGIAVRRLMLTTIVVWTIFLLVGQLGYRRTVAAIRAGLLALMLANYAAVAAAPSVGIHQGGQTDEPGLEGDWRGVMPHKNFAGAICAFTILILIIDTGSVPAALRWGGVLGAAYFLHKTGSKTSIGILFVSLLSAWAFTRYNPRYRFVVIPLAAVAAVAVALLLYVNWGIVSARFDSPDALTGRVQIWPVLMAYSREHPVGGSGYGAFWNVGAASPAYRHASGWVSEITSGHNGYLDLLAQIGIPGLLLAIGSALVAPLVTLAASLTAPRQRGALLVSLVVFCAGHNLTESSLFDRDSLVQVVLMFAIALISVVTAPSTAHRPARTPR